MQMILIQDHEKREKMKACAFAVMYGSNPDAKVLLPPDLIEGLEVQ
jgi:hypothetical protein